MQRQISKTYLLFPFEIAQCERTLRIKVDTYSIKECTEMILKYVVK